MKGPTISGFMALRNAAETGYPFVEAIVSALPICDEFIIADGHSSDDTWACLKELQRRSPERIKLYQDAWPAWRDFGRIMVTVSNLVRARCRGDYCLHLQANDVLHEACREEIRSLPLLFPDIELFRLPNCNYLGPDDQIVFDFRRRLFANKPRIALVGDAYDAGYLRWQLLKTPRRFLPYVLHRTGEKLCYLRDPLHRYWGFAPENYMTKVRQRVADYDDEIMSPAWRQELELAEQVFPKVSPDDPNQDAFWQPLVALWHHHRYGGRWVEGQALGPHPKVMQPLFGQWRYDPWASLERIGDI